MKQQKTESQQHPKITGKVVKKAPVINKSKAYITFVIDNYDYENALDRDEDVWIKLMHNFGNNTKEISSIVLHATLISCGVYQIYNIQSLNRLFTKENQTNVHPEEVISNLFSYIKGIIKCANLIASNNTLPSQVKINNIFDNLANSYTVPTKNPKTNNTIKVWVF